MKKVPRGEICNAKDIIYPEKKGSQNRMWHLKNLKNIREQEEKNRKTKQEKENYVAPEPYKMKEFKNVKSKLAQNVSSLYLFFYFNFSLFRLKNGLGMKEVKSLNLIPLTKPEDLITDLILSAKLALD